MLSHKHAVALAVVLAANSLAINGATASFPGADEIQSRTLENGLKVRLATKKMRVDINRQLCRRLDDLLGSGGYEMVVDRKKLSARAEPQKKWSGRG